MRIVLIGGTGVISSAVASEAVARGHDVTLVNRGRSTVRPVPDGVRVITADARDPHALSAALGRREFDVAADFTVFTPDHARNDIDTFRGRTGQFVFISTASAYQKPLRTHPITESTPLANPFWRYSRDKIACEDVLRDAHAAGTLPVTIVRPSHTYDRTKVPLGGWTFVDRLRAGKPILIPGDGTTQWTLTHADDVAPALVALFGAREALGEAFHIVGDEAPTWDAIAETLADAAGVAAPDLLHTPSDLLARFDPRMGESWLGDRSHSMVFDNAKIKSVARGWVQRIPFAEGARRIVEWYDADASRRVVDPALDALSDRIAAFLRRPL